MADSAVRCESSRIGRVPHHGQKRVFRPGVAATSPSWLHPHSLIRTAAPA
ncbi:hypothetical protein BIFBIF_00304 [Bifidobacterium bifidum ATCC 29521 = JCM 1255 = DSM 20456]|nr:hypothetical protein BIFBIF_00304 [Bifidobacterium bifidum ATCC 29521 = JCM 1255 = DSM 20456]